MNKPIAPRLTHYLSRLHDGEDLQTLREEFRQEFLAVDAKDIVEAEKILLEGGTPLGEVQRLCDLHSALFEGRTKEERMKEAKETSPLQSIYDEKHHPLSVLHEENLKLLALLEEGRTEEILEGLTIHYKKKGDLLYPHLADVYGVSGPAQVMWQVDDEIRDVLKAKDYDATLPRIREMVSKEENILFPLCAEHFTKEDWARIARDARDYGEAFGVTPVLYGASEDLPQENREILLPGGSLTLQELRAMMAVLPLEVSVVDGEDINRYFNEGEKIFKRPSVALGHSVYTSHPPRVQPMVKKILTSFRQGEKDRVELWMELKGKPLLISYVALRDEEKNYIGTVEFVQDMSAARDHFQRKAPSA